MASINISHELLDNYSAQFKFIDSCIHEFEVVMNQKNVEDVVWVLQRMESFKNILHENFIENIKNNLKDRKLGKSLDEIKLYICSNLILSKIERIICIDIADKYKISIDEWIDNNHTRDLENPMDLIYHVNKFTFWALLNVRSLILIWDKKDLGTFPICEFVDIGHKVCQSEFKQISDLEKYIEIHKDKTRIHLFKGKIIAITSNISSAKVYLERLIKLKKA